MGIMSERAEDYPLDKLRVERPQFDDDVQISEKTIGKGANNKVFVLIKNKVKLVLRAPRRRSDTQERGSALWEFRQTLKAAQLGVAPTIHDAWYARHAKGEWTSGLYLVMDRYECSLEDAIVDDAEKRSVLLKDEGRIGKQIASQVVQGLEKLANSLLFVYDLKLSNIVIRLDEEKGEATARIVDFGRDFCEWSTGCNDPLERSPIIDGLRRLVKQRGREENVDDVVRHVLFAAMLIQLSATTTYGIYQDRHAHKMDADTRKEMNLFAPYAETLLQSMMEDNISLLRWVLRDDDVRGVLRHYNTRRKSGTGRSLRFAVGEEK